MIQDTENQYIQILLPLPEMDKVSILMNEVKTLHEKQLRDQRRYFAQKDSDAIRYAELLKRVMLLEEHFAGEMVKYG